MKIRLFAVWFLVRGGYWFLPALMAGGALVLSTATIAIDDIVHGRSLAGLVWIYAGGPDGARALLSTVAASMNLNRVVLEYLERAGAPAGVDLVMHLADDLPDLYADPEQLGLVLGNLVRNAVQAMPEGGRLTIETVRNADATIELAVVNTGIGISAEHRHRIFEPLFTTKAKGVGLGLVVVKRLTLANGGDIEVQSEPGEGARFVLRFTPPA